MNIPMTLYLSNKLCEECKVGLALDWWWCQEGLREFKENLRLQIVLIAYLFDRSKFLLPEKS